MVFSLGGDEGWWEKELKDLILNSLHYFGFSVKLLKAIIKSDTDLIQVK